MPVLTKTCGIVIRMLIDRALGTRFHAFYGDAELVIGLEPLRVIQGEFPPWIQAQAVDWVRDHQTEVRRTWHVDVTEPTPLARQAASHLESRNR